MGSTWRTSEPEHQIHYKKDVNETRTDITFPSGCTKGISTLSSLHSQKGSTSNVQSSSIGLPTFFFNRLSFSVQVKWNALADWLCFLYRWVVSTLSLGTVLCIRNESEETLALYIKTKFANATGFGDWTWHLYQKGWSYIPEKAQYWRIAPKRRNTFVLPFCTCLIVLGTEANFTYFLVHDAGAPGERFATIWTSFHSFIPRFVRVTSDLVVTTKLRMGQANASKPKMEEAFKQSGLFKAVPDLMFCHE